MPRTALLIAAAAGLAMIAAGVDPWLALAVTLVWAGSLWLSRPAPDFAAAQTRIRAVSLETLAPLIEPLGVPLLLLENERIIAANLAAREALGAHVVGQDARVALRHPQAIALLSDDAETVAEVEGLTSPRSLWRVSRFQIGEQQNLIELIDRSAAADISRAHTDFVANASHELRTPLASVIGYLEALSEPGGGIDTATRARFFDTARREARRMQSLLDDLMSLSRIEAEKHDVPRAEVDLAGVVNSVVRDIEAAQPSQRFVIDGAESPAVIAGDRSQIEQLLRNLLDNAMRYGDAGQPVRIRIAEGPGRWIILNVIDRGPGISREHLPHLTRRFYRIDPGRSRAGGGTGLGLAIVKHIVERHAGELEIESVQGVGTTVTTRFPRLEPPMSKNCNTASA